MMKKVGCLTFLIGFIVVATFFIFAMSVPPFIFLTIFFIFYFLLLFRSAKKESKESSTRSGTKLEENDVEEDSGKEKSDKLKSELNELNDVIKAFKILGLSMDASYTKVNQTYYKLVQKIRKSKMPEEERQKKLKELENAYNVLQNYYAKKY